jgi:hypothetical protein
LNADARRKPAEKLQLRFEAGLVERILDAVGDEPGNLPLLEFVLTQLWEKRRGGLLLNESYDTMGKLKGHLYARGLAHFGGGTLGWSFRNFSRIAAVCG